MTRVLVLRNRQRTHALNLPLLRRLTRHALEHELGATHYEVGFHFVDSDEMARVNEQFLRHEGSTDVITFDHAGSGAPAYGPARHGRWPKHAGSEAGAPRLHGEIFISVPDAVKQAREFRTTWQSEVVRYIIHGLLHLRGYDDLVTGKRRVMKRAEQRVLRQVEKCFPIAAIAGRRSRLPTVNSQPS